MPVTLALGLLIANALNRGITRFRTVFRVGYYLPVITSIVAIAVVWRFLLNPDVGLDQHAARRASGSTGPAWLADPALAMPSIIAMAVWRNLGFAMVVFLAGMQAIPASLYEAAVDRRRRPLAGVPLRDHPDAPADDPVHDRHHDDRLPPAVRGAVRDDRRRSARQDAVGDDVHVPAGVRSSSTRATHRRSPTSCS